MTDGVAAGEDGTTVSIVVRGRAAAEQFAANSGATNEIEYEASSRERTIQNSLGFRYRFRYNGSNTVAAVL